MMSRIVVQDGSVDGTVRIEVDARTIKLESARGRIIVPHDCSAERDAWVRAMVTTLRALGFVVESPK